MKKRSIPLFLSTWFMTSNALASSTYDLTVEVKDFRSARGEVIFSLFNQKEDWLNKDRIFRKQTIPVGSPITTLTFENIPAGTYALSILHDENGDGKMQTRFLGIPAEGLAISNDASFQFGPPRFSDARFSLEEDTKIQCSVTYFSFPGVQ